MTVNLLTPLPGLGDNKFCRHCNKSERDDNKFQICDFFDSTLAI
jgi:hypothetical protein